MRPIIRRDERDELDVARRLVSAAERQALERAEQLSRDAEDLLDAAAGSADGQAAGLAARVAALEDELRAATDRAAAQAEEVGRLRAEQHQLKIQLDRLQCRVDSAGAAGAAASDPLDAVEGQHIPALLATAREAEKLLSAAMSAIEDETERAAGVRAEAERIRRAAADESERIIGAARAEADEIRRRARSEGRSEARSEGRADGRAGLEEARRRLVEETAGLRTAMDQTWSTLEKLIGSQDRPAGPRQD